MTSKGPFQPKAFYEAMILWFVTCWFCCTPWCKYQPHLGRCSHVESLLQHSENC